MFQRICFMGALLLAGLASAQTQTFTVGQWFVGKNVASDLPAGAVDLADSFWASETYTCPIVFAGPSGAAVPQIACQAHAPGARFETVIAEGDPRLAGTHLAVRATANNNTGRHLISMVRPELKNLYFTSFTGTTPATYSSQMAWRYRDYKTLEKIAASGDRVSIQRLNGLSLTIRLSTAGPVDADESGREFIYLDSAESSVYGLFEIKGGTFVQLTNGIQRFRDSPWGMGGFTFDDGGLVYRESISLYQLDPNNTNGFPGLIAQEGDTGKSFMPPNINFANLDNLNFFRPTNDLTTFYFNWGSVQGAEVPNDFFSIWKDWTMAPFYTNALATTNASTAAVIASGDRVTVMGTGPRGSGTADFDPNSRLSVIWPVTSLWLNRNGGWQRILQESQLPDASVANPKKFYQGLTAYKCSVEFASKRNDLSSDNSGPLYGFYRLIRPCIDSATFNTVSRELVVTGINLQDARTEIGIPSGTQSGSGAPLGQLIAAQVTSTTPTEVKARLESITSLDNVLVLLNGAVWSDPFPVKIVTSPAPILQDVKDFNYERSIPSPAKIMRLGGALGCLTATAPTVNYPTTLGNCAVLLDGSVRLPLIFTKSDEITYVLPSDLTAVSHSIRVNRTDATGTFTSEPYPFAVSPHWPIPVKDVATSQIIVVVIRNNQVVVLQPGAPIRPGEYFTFYLTGALLNSLPARALLGTTETPYAAAVVNWAQGIVQVNVQAPATAIGDTTLTMGTTVSIPVSIR